MGYARAGSNPVGVVNIFILYAYTISILVYIDKCLYDEKYYTTPAGFEPARENPNRFQVYRLNHSAIVP